MEVIDIYLEESTVNALFDFINNSEHEWHGWKIDRVVERIVINHLYDLNIKDPQEWKSKFESKN